MKALTKKQGMYHYSIIVIGGEVTVLPGKHLKKEAALKIATEARDKAWRDKAWENWNK